MTDDQRQPIGATPDDLSLDDIGRADDLPFDATDPLQREMERGGQPTEQHPSGIKPLDDEVLPHDDRPVS